MFPFASKNAVVTGGCSGIGFEIVKTFLQHGIKNIAILDLDDSKNIRQSLEREYESQNVLFIKTDVSKKDQVKTAFDTITEQFEFIDFVVNNAGIICEKDYERTINVNLLGTLHVTYAAIEVMSKEKGGRGGIIASISSVAGIDTIPSMPSYCSSKHGIIGLNRCFSNNFYYEKHDINFITICPGVTDTPILDDFENKVNFGGIKDTLDEVTSFQFQTPATVAQRISEILILGKNGSIWIIHEGECHEIFLQRYYAPSS